MKNRNGLVSIKLRESRNIKTQNYREKKNSAPHPYKESHNIESIIITQINVIIFVGYPVSGFLVGFSIH